MPDEAAYSLEMPFVVCESQGGPYEDNAYAAGWEAAYWDLELRRMAEFTSGYVVAASIHVGNQDQIDLIAMKHGWVASFEPYDEDWATVTFTLPDAADRAPA